MDNECLMCARHRQDAAEMDAAADRYRTHLVDLLIAVNCDRGASIARDGMDIAVENAIVTLLTLHIAAGETP